MRCFQTKAGNLPPVPETPSCSRDPVVPALALRPHAASVPCSLLARPRGNSFLANGRARKTITAQTAGPRGPQAEAF